VPAALQIAFPATTGQYIRLQALSEINGNPWTSVAELNVLGAVSANTPPPSLAQVTVNPAIVVGGASAQGTVTLSEPAPAGGAVVNLSSSNTAVATVPASVTVLAGNYTATFTLMTTSLGSSTQVTIGGNYNGNQSATLTVNFGSLIPQTVWSVAYVDSQEISCFNGAATNAIDGNTATFWHTQFCGADPSTPHEIQINLGASYQLTAFQYLPRQDGCGNGWIKQYAFYVSTDGVNWGTAVAAGTFNYGALSTACPGAGVPAAIQVNFTSVTGQYIRLQALSEINLSPWTSVAEIDVLGARAYTVALSWSPSASPVMGYYLYRATVSGGPYSQINTVPLVANNYVDNQIEYGQTYYYVVTAVTSSGQQSTYSNQTAVVIPMP